MDFAHYLYLGLSIFTINLVPAFMPPTWSILTYLTARFDLFILPTIVIGAIAAVSGRVVLALLARYFFRGFLPKKTQVNLDSLGIYLKHNKKWTLPFILAYAFSPIPSNQLFMAAGLSGFDIKYLATSFFVGRMLSYSIWVSAGTFISEFLKRIFAKNHSLVCSLLIEIVGFVFIYLISIIPWKKLLKTKSH